MSCRSIADFNFDHPHAFAFDEIVECLRSLKQGRPVQIPQVTHLQQGLLPAAACCMSCSAEAAQVLGMTICTSHAVLPAYGGASSA